MNIFCYSLFILLIWSTPGFGESLSQIEEKLALRLQGAENTTVQESDVITNSWDVAKPIEDIPPARPTPPILNFESQNQVHAAENFSHPFSVQVGSSRSLKLCYRVASMLRTLGYPAFSSSIKLKNRGIWHRVYIGSFSTRDAAQKVKDQLSAETIGEGFIRHLPYAVQIGTSGTLEQLGPLYKSLLASSHFPYSTSIRNASSGVIEERLLIGACYKEEDCDLLLSNIVAEGFNAVVVER
ncbi:SPOR domain-containing protein [Desulforhopalus sp. 52FAK]